VFQSKTPVDCRKADYEQAQWGAAWQAPMLRIQNKQKSGGRPWRKQFCM
jgi:hypothetical protein